MLWDFVCFHGNCVKSCMLAPPCKTHRDCCVVRERKRDRGRQAGMQPRQESEEWEVACASLANWLQGTYVFLPCPIVIANRRNQRKQRLPYYYYTHLSLSLSIISAAMSLSSCRLLPLPLSPPSTKEQWGWRRETEKRASSSSSLVLLGWLQLVVSSDRAEPARWMDHGHGWLKSWLLSSSCAHLGLV
jgi:hypothetical protein